MHHGLDTDQLRSEFKHRFSAWVVESKKLQDLLIALEDSTDAEKLYDIRQQQVKVTKAKAAYDKARAAYTGHVLAGFVGCGGTIL